MAGPIIISAAILHRLAPGLKKSDYYQTLKIRYVVGAFARYKLGIEGITSMILTGGSLHIRKVQATTLIVRASFTIVLFNWG